MDYNSLIKNWHVKADNEIDYFSKFVFEYLSFIAYLKTQLFTDIDKDRSAIQKLKQNTAIKTQYLNTVQSNPSLQNSWKEIRNKLVAKSLVNESVNSTDDVKWWNCSHYDLINKTEEEKRKQKGVIHSLDDWENMIEFWYSIRNNLFHAYKNPEDDRDHFLVEYGCKTLSKLMVILLNENQN